MSNLTNLRVTGSDVLFSLSLTDSQRKLIPDTAPQVVEITVQKIDALGNPGNFWDFVTPGFTIVGPAEPAMTNVPETLIIGVHTGKYEIKLVGAYVLGLDYVSVHIKCTGKDKSNFYYVDYIHNAELIDEILTNVLAIQTAMSRQGFRKEKISNETLQQQNINLATELRDLEKKLRRGRVHNEKVNG